MSWATRHDRIRARRRSTRRGIPAAAWFGAQSFHAFLSAPTTAPILDAMLHDNAATDAAIEAARNEERDENRGDACSSACGYCGACSGPEAA